MNRARNHSNGSALAEFDPFTPAGPQAAQPDESPAQLLLKLHRLLRGRYVLALVLAAAGAIAGGAAGYFSTAPKWQSYAAIRIEPIRQIILENTPEREIAYFDSYVQEQVICLEEQKTLDRAMFSPEWQKFGRGTDMKAKNKFRNSLSVFVDRNSRKWIKVRFVDGDREAARTGVRQVIDAYREIFGPRLLIGEETVIRTLRRERERIEGEIRSYDARLREIGERFLTTELVPLHTKALEKHRQAEEELGALERHLGQLEATRSATPETGEKPQPPKLDWKVGSREIAKVDAAMRKLVDMRDDARLELLRLEVKYAPDSPPMREATDKLQAIERRTEELYTEWMAAHDNQLPITAGATGVSVLATEPIEVIRAKRDFARSVADRFRDEAIAISNARRDVDSINAEIAARRKDLNRVEERLNLLTLETQQQPQSTTQVGRIEIVSDGEEATLYSDARKKLGALGFLLGGSLPVFGVMLIGAIDRRFRYSDDAQAGTSKVPLLGILPFLPDVANDPEQAGIAAHCVHQIRTLLQIGGVEHDRKVFAITSATSGDGKTSLCLSLGLSFAASGSNTLLIDFDMIGGGLTANMGARTDVGLLAAIDDGQLEGHVRPTAFPRLSLIPTGRDDSQEISRLSPKLVKRLIDQARKQYDVIVIDTGPVLGSIEATLVCGVADGVVLALGRGQQKGMANRAVETLRSIGAHIMGVVFNRAQAGDFKRTVSQSVRSIPMHDSGQAPSLKALPSLGPMARTVATHLRTDG